VSIVSTFAAIALSAPFILYSPPGGRAPKVEATIDKGPILEMIVRCPVGTGILTYSKVEKLYCGPRGGCDKRLEPIVQRLCR
jgi:hypothetical protein